MGQKSNPSPSQPLRGVRVLVGRARHQAGALSAELRRLGAEVLEIPFIEIRKPRSFLPLDAALRNLARYDWLILTSVNGVEAMWQRMQRLNLSGRLAGNTIAGNGPRIAAIGPATKAAIEKRDVKVDIVPREYIAESIVRSLKAKVKGRRVLLVRAQVARDVIPRELRKAGARVDVVEAYQTVVPQSSRRRLQAAMKNPKRRPHVVTFTSSSTVRNFVALLGARSARPRRTALKGYGMLMASIGPVTASTLREVGLSADIKADDYTIPGLVNAIASAFASEKSRWQ
jgi:uroporphyrinogen-III synthase